MLFVQLTGLSGSGKTTVSERVANRLNKLGYRVEVLDGDLYQRRLWPELTFSASDRQENIRRLRFIGQRMTHHGLIIILAAINPYEHVRAELSALMPRSKLVFVHCDLPTLLRRDTKGLYARSLLPPDHVDKITNRLLYSLPIVETVIETCRVPAGRRISPFCNRPTDDFTRIPS